MDWENLRFLLAVAREGSFRGAARVLGVNQSTLSRRVARLEAGLGVRLFDRLPSGLALTAAGQRMADAAERMEGAAADAGRARITADSANVVARTPRRVGPVRWPAASGRYARSNGISAR